MSFLLAVPNISEGRNRSIVEEIAGRDDLLDIDMDPDHNRSVLTYAGPADTLATTLTSMVERAVTLLDIGGHAGVHPRSGVVDVLPIVPYAADERAATILLADLTWRIAQGPGVPMLRYGRADEAGVTLPELRRHLRSAPLARHPTAGVICVGIRDPLIAFNVQLDATVAIARRIAGRIRRPGIRALGFELPSRGCVQVSMNLTDPEHVGPRQAFDAVAGETATIIDAEVVGLVPASVVQDFDGLPMREPVATIEARISSSRG